MVMSIIAGSSTIAASIISMQKVDLGTNTLLVHVDSIFVGLAMFHAPAHSRTWRTRVRTVYNKYNIGTYEFRWRSAW